MANETSNKPMEQIQELKQYLPEKTQEELDEILAYGEKMKLEGERKKQEFWKNHDRNDFKKLLRYKRENKNRIEGQYKYLDMIEGLERERFIEEYLHDDMLYSGKLDEPIEGELCSYNCWKEGNAVIKVGTNLFFCNNQIGAEGAKAIAGMELKEGVNLDLQQNGIGDEGAEAIMKNMKLKEGVSLYLRYNNISDKMKKKLEEWEKSYKKRGIKCIVIV